MLWRCPACNRETEEPVCARCRTPKEAGEPSAATGLMKETAGSVLFLIAAICFTAAVLFTAVFSWISPKTAVIPSVKEVKSAVVGFADVTNTSLSPYALKAVSTLYDEVAKETATEPSGELPLWNILVVVGLWLTVAQGYTNRVNFRKGGPIVLKVAAVMGTVGACIVTVCGVLLCAGLWCFRADMVKTLMAESDAIATAIRHLLACEATMWLLLGLCVLLAVGGIVYLLFFASVTRVLNRLLETAKTGGFGKRAGGLAGVFLCAAALFLLAETVRSFLHADLGGVASLLYGAAFLLFGITLFRYRRRARMLALEQPAFTGETVVAAPGIPTGLKASDLMNEPSAGNVPMAPPAAPMRTTPLTPRRTLGEPFTEEALEPKPMTGNGCCPQCGTPIPDKAFFCLTCGRKLG